MNKLLLIPLLLFFMQEELLEQDDFLGTISYEQTVDGLVAEQAKTMMPSMIDYTVGEEAVWMDMTGPLKVEEKGQILFTDGTRFMVEDAKKIIYDVQDYGDESMNYEFEQTTEHKEILGYDCKLVKMLRSSEWGDSMHYEIWVATDFHKQGFYSSNPEVQKIYDGLGGLPLAIQQDMRGLSIRIQATNIKEKAPKAKRFKLPNYDFEEMPQSAIMLEN